MFVPDITSSTMACWKIFISIWASYACPQLKQLKQIFNMNTTVQAAKAVGAGCATVALAGVGTGVGAANNTADITVADELITLNSHQ